MESGKRKRKDDLPRITYIAGDRTFERLFKETSLNETKEVVRRKLLLPSYATIKLKQLRDGKSIDLDDDDDFDAFYAQARSVMSIDVAVEISPPMTLLETLSATSNQPPRDADTTVATEPQLKKRKKVSGESVPVTSSKLSAKEKLSTDPTDGQPPNKKPKTAKADASKEANSTEAVTKHTKKSLADPTDGQPPKKSKAAKAEMSKDVTKPSDEPPIDPADEQPPKKKRKTAKVDTSKDVTKPTENPPNKIKKGLDANELLDSMFKEMGESSGIKKKVTTKSLAPKVSGDRSVNYTDNGLAISEKTKVKRKPKDKELEAQASKPGAKTSASTKGRRKVIAEVAVPKENKSKESKRDKAKASDADVSRPLDAIDIRDIVNRLANATMISSKMAKATTKDKIGERNLVETSQPSASSPPSVIKTTKSGPLCHVCFGPFHPLYRCPTVLAGRKAIRNKLEELKKARTSEHQLAIKDLESLLDSPSVAVSPASNAAQKNLELDNESEREAMEAAEESASHSRPSWTPLMPNHSLLSEVTIESRHEGSSSEEEDEFDQETDEEGHDVEAGQPSLDDVDLGAIIRGPTPIKLHNLISTMVSKEDESDTEDEGGDMGPLEVEDDNVEERRYRRPLQPLAGSSDELGDGDDEDGADNDDNEHRSMLPPKQNFSNVLPFGESELAARPNDSTSKGQAGSRTHVPTSDTDDTRVSVSGTPYSNKDLARDDSKAAETLYLGKPSDTSPAGGISHPHNKNNNDPIEPADDLVISPRGGTFDIDPIESPTSTSLKGTIPLSPAIHSTPKSSVVKRMKNRPGQLHSPSQFPVRTDEPEIHNRPMTRSAKVAARTGGDKPSIRGGTGGTRVDLPRVSSQPVGRGGANGHATTPFHSQPLPKATMSLAKWDAISEPSPTIMTDEIDPSSPLLNGSGDILGELAGKASNENDTGGRSDDDSTSKSQEPLFTLTASQVPFPYSQYNVPIQKRLEVASDSGMESETNGGSEKKETAAKTRGSMYRKLSDIAANKMALFSQRKAVLPGLNSKASRERWQDDEDDETSSSDSDSANQSHIPEGNRAGKLRSKKRKGPLALNY